eukprot:6006862-Prymnesium_polylepis.1
MDVEIAVATVGIGTAVTKADAEAVLVESTAAATSFADAAIGDDPCMICLEVPGTTGGVIAELQCSHRHCADCLTHTLEQRAPRRTRQATHGCLLCDAPCLNAPRVECAKPSPHQRSERIEVLKQRRQQEYTTITYSASSEPINTDQADQKVAAPKPCATKAGGLL